MNKKLFLAFPTYKAFDLAVECIESAMSGTLRPDSIIVVDNSGNSASLPYIQPLMDKYKNIYIWPQTYNLGCARTWNLVHKTINRDYIVMVNDDIKFHEHTLERMVEEADRNVDEVLFTAMAGNAYSIFLLKNKGFKHIGEFDEKFYPAYYEDGDYDHRREILGYRLVVVDGADCDHVRSATIARYTQKEMEDHNRAFLACESYFRTKWGGLPHDPNLYREAFNGLI